VNAILHFLASGHAWFASGLYFLLLTALDAARVLDGHPVVRRVAQFLLVLSLPLAALSAPPLRLFLVLPLTLASCVHAGATFSHRSLRVRRTSAVAAGGLVIAALSCELPYYIGPAPPAGPAPARLYILGDSLTAGGYGETLTWPKILAQSSTVEIHDLSRDGDTVKKALEEQGSALREAPFAGTWVFLEIGGNDVLGEASLGEFEESLDRLLALCRGEPRSPRTVVMMEIPTVFGRWGFAATQRRLSCRHGVVLIPRRVLAGIVFSRGATGGLDGLHLSQSGQERFAAAAGRWLRLSH
jgi:lysophospholipase L1-like esterase